MDPDQESQDDKECEVMLRLFSTTPVVGCLLEPVVLFRDQGSLRPPPHALSFTWYRKQVNCSVHHSKLASVQCTSCVKLKVPVKESYHCSRECFVAAWPDHLVRHRIAANTKRMTRGSDQQELKSLRSCGSWSDLGSAMVAQEERDKVGSSETYEPNISDAGFCLWLECYALNPSTGTAMSPITILETEPVIDFPPHIPRCMIQLEKLENWSLSDVTFSVLSYNILADMYASIDKNLQRYCPAWALTWNYRRKNLLREIMQYNADIICLQEVQSDHFENFFEPELTKCGYSVMYKKKSKSVCVY